MWHDTAEELPDPGSLVIGAGHGDGGWFSDGPMKVLPSGVWERERFLEYDPKIFTHWTYTPGHEPEKAEDPTPLIDLPELDMMAQLEKRVDALEDKINLDKLVEELRDAGRRGFDEGLASVDGAAAAQSFLAAKRYHDEFCEYRNAQNETNDWVAKTLKNLRKTLRRVVQCI
jgi:hypothetical protein